MKKDDWYGKPNQKDGSIISYKDIQPPPRGVLVNWIFSIINKDFEKIRRLMQYFRNIATIITLLGLPIIWHLPHGLVVR